MTFEKETEANFQKFFGAWTAQAESNWKALHSSPLLLASYRRIAAFNSLKSDLLEQQIDEASFAFFQEAHNDALQSHVCASVGSWRLALKSLRSFLENSFNALYFMDHPIELQNWARGREKLWFSELLKYFDDHPDLAGNSLASMALAELKTEYSTLSKAVHGSAKSFRMTDDVSKVLLWSTKQEKIGAWSTREKQVLSNVAVIVIALFRDDLSGAKLPGTRQALRNLFGVKATARIKSELGITLS